MRGMPPSEISKKDNQWYVDHSIDPDFLEFLHRLTHGGENDTYEGEGIFKREVSRDGDEDKNREDGFYPDIRLVLCRKKKV